MPLLSSRLTRTGSARRSDAGRSVRAAGHNGVPVTTSRRALAVSFCLLGVFACDESSSDKDKDLPQFSGTGMNIGGALCVSGPTSAKASSLERALVLAGEFVNGSTHAFPGVATEDIPCRKAGLCGVWMGTDATGAEIRGPMVMRSADTEEHVSSAVNAASLLQSEYQVPVVIGPCTSDEMIGMFNDVTGTNTVLVTPAVTADEITDLDDRTAADKAASLPGYVYRMIVPDYIQAQVLAQIGTNTTGDLIRYEDWTDDECTETTSSTYCNSHGAGYACLESTKLAAIDKDYYRVTDDRCDNQPDGYCDKLGLNSECYDAGGSNKVCARFRARKFCAKQVLPQTAMVLYQDDSFGSGLKAEAEDFWVNRKDRLMLSTQSFDPTRSDGFADALQQLFENADAQLAAEKTAGTVPADYALEDSIVFLFAQAQEAALIFQEVSIQRQVLPGAAQGVFWLGTDSLRSPLLLDQVPLESVRNVYAVDPYALDPVSEDFFTQLFTSRWGEQPDSFAGNVFDSVLMVALANERAGKLRRDASGSTSQPPTGASEIKDSLQAVSKGCLTPGIADRCSENTNAITAYFPQQLTAAMRALNSGSSQLTKFVGVTGDAELSPEGDRSNRVRLWKVAPSGSHPGFFNSSTISPTDEGLFLRK
jgi:ABC-type branched-subunit amino acid transport system substrate-binding protein